MIEKLNFIALFQWVWAGFIYPKLIVKQELPSISQSYGYFKEKGGTSNWQFIAFCWGTGLPMWFYSFMGFGGYPDLCFILSGSFLMMASLSSAKLSHGNWHYIVTISAMVLAAFGLYLQYQRFDWLLGFAGVAGIMSVMGLKNKLYWIELAFIHLVFAQLILRP